MTTKFVEIVHAYESARSSRETERQVAASVFASIRLRLLEAWGLKGAFVTQQPELRLEDDGVTFRASVLTLHVPRLHDVQLLAALDHRAALRGKEKVDVAVFLRAKVEGGKALVCSDYSSEEVAIRGPGDQEAIDRLLERMHEGIKSYVAVKGSGR